MSRKIDHIVYCVPHFEEAITDIENKLGAKITIGGKHLTQGTKNALIHLGNKCYLEILAVDHSNKDINPPRWMGVDLLQSAKITRWALKTKDIMADSKSLNEYNSEMGKITGGSRKMTNGNMLTWRIVMPLAEPEVDIAPFITDWSESKTHPTDTLDQNCQLVKLKLSHPNPSQLQNLFTDMNIDVTIHKSKNQSIKATIQCPNGLVEL